jgi:hypothetical protein
MQVVRRINAVSKFPGGVGSVCVGYVEMISQSGVVTLCSGDDARVEGFVMLGGRSCPCLLGRKSF